MENNFIYDESTINNIFSDDILSDRIPSEKDPFCNETEEISYNEDYSHIVPGFFFRNKKCDLKPDRAEKARLRYFYNTTGILMIAGLFLFSAVFVLVLLIALMFSYSFNISTHSFGYILKDDIVVFSCAAIAAAVSVPVVCKAGCGFSELTFHSLFRNKKLPETRDILCGIMTGLFLLSLGNTISMVLEYFTGCSFVHSVTYKADIRQILIIFIFRCLIIPVSQGIFFRGIAMKNMSRASQKFGMYFISIMCAALSLSVVEIIPAFFLSLMLARITIKYDTVNYGIIIHIVINSCNFLINIYRDVFMNSEVFVTNIWTIVTMSTGAVFAAYFVIKERSPRMNPEQFRRTFPVAVTSVFLHIALFICVLITAAGTLLFL